MTGDSQNGSQKSTISRRAPSDFAVDYGLDTFGDLFTPRQLVALTTFSDLVQEARERVKQTPLAAGLPETASPSPMVGRRQVRRAVGVYLAFAVDKASRLQLALCSVAAQRRAG